MLTKHKSFFNSLLKTTIFPLIFIIFTSFLSFSLSADTKCAEQWKEIELVPENWTSVGHANVTLKNDTGVSFEFENTDSSSGGDVVGAVWHEMDFSQKKGLHISFRPQITSDPSYGGSVKYPQGFAIVFTSSSIENLVGEKGSGIGYEGIINAVVFEFDFIKQVVNGDQRNPHFSVLYNISGPVSPKHSSMSQTIYKDLPNFYDNSLDGYYKNIIFEIQLIGNRIIVKSNRATAALIDTTFTAFQQLLEQEEVHVGITSSMAINKKVIISDFKISEISAKEKGTLSLKGSSSTFNAGEEVILLYSIESTCGEKLKIYSNEYLSDQFNLKINNKIEIPRSITFNETTVQVQISVQETLENIYSATVEFKGDISSPTKFTIQASSVQRLELCEVDKNNRYKITSELKQTEKYFYIPICSYDQFGNPNKYVYNAKKETRIKYPNNLIPDDISETEDGESENQKVLKVAIGTFGDYEFLNEDFIDEKKRYLSFLPKRISPEKSEVSILYENNIVQEDTENISFRIQLKDSYGRHIPTIILDKLECDFSESTLNGEKFSFSKDNTEDYVILSIEKPTSKNKYTFVPKVKCNGIEETTLFCDNDPVTKINNCEFYYQSDNINTQYIKAYSDFLDKYITFGETTGEEYLIISLDEAENKKLTDIILLDDKGSIYFQPSTNEFTAKLDNTDLKVIQIGYKISLVLPENMNRENFSRFQTHSIIFSDGTNNYIIPIKFYYLEHIINNIDISSEILKIDYIAFYKQTSLKLRASETFLLFDIYERYDSKYLGKGESLDIAKVSLYLNDKDDTKNSEIVLYNNFISVIYHGLTKAGTHNIALKYNGNELQNINIEITPKNEAYSLGDKDGKKLETTKILLESEKVTKLTLLDKYGNILKDNQVFNAFSKIKISNPDTFMIKPNYDGRIHLLNHGKTESNEVTLTIYAEEEIIYTIKSDYTPTINDVDPLLSYAIFEKEPFIKAGYALNVEISVVLKDKYGNKFTPDDLENKISAFVEGVNIKKEILPLYLNPNLVLGNYQFRGTLGKIGDFSIKVFFDDYPIECRGCNIRSDIDSNNNDFSKSILYIMGNKRRIPIPNYVKDKSIKAGLVNNNNNFYAYYEQRDKNLNEVKDSKSYSFNIASTNNKNPIGDTKICSYGSDDEEKGFMKICSNGVADFKRLKEGLYEISKSGDDSIKFYIYITNSEIDTEKTTPSLANSMILSNDDKIFGKTDIPGSFILDLRTENYKRINGLDKTKITITSEEEGLNYKVVDGPENGLLTVFLYAKKPGKYEFNVNYDGNKIIEDTYTFICGCGFEKSLKFKNQGYLRNGNYIFFTLTDLNNNACNTAYYLTDLNINQYANNIIKATGGSNKVFKTETYYNPLTSTFVLYFNRHVSGSVELSSTLINIDKSLAKVDLTTYILDENHFYATKGENELVIKALDDNYEEATSQVLKNDFDVSLIRLINNDFVVLKNDFVVDENLNVDTTAAGKLLTAKGKYLYIIYYKGKEIFCENCIFEVNKNEVNLEKIKIYHKEGNNNFIESNYNTTLPLYKSNFPFFKINLMNEDNNLVIVNSGVKVTLKLGEITSFELDIKYSTNGNIYAYLDQSKRKMYLNLKSMDNIKLEVTYTDPDSDSELSYLVNYYFIDHYAKEPSSIENCSEGAIPTIVNKQSLYIKRVDEELELEIYLSGCDTEEKTIINKLSIISEDDSSNVECNVIPTDIYGGYLLFLPTNLNVADSKKYYIKNNKSKSEQFELSILPGYEINEITFKKDENLIEVQTDKLYTYFFAELKDNKNNIITNIGRNLFANDIDGINANNLPYKLSYDNKMKAFRVQVPINDEKLSISTIKNPSSNFVIEVENSKDYSYSFVKLTENSDNKFTFEFELKNEFYKTTTSSEYTSYVSFRYISINPMTDEIFIRDIKSTLEGNQFTVTLPNTFPKYSIYGFVPLIKKIPQVCPSCFKKNSFLNYIYSIGENGYLPHKIDKTHYLIQNHDVPIYAYLAHETITIEPTNIGSEEIELSSNSRFYIISSKEGDSIKITFTSESKTKIFSINFIDYDKTGTLEDKSNPAYTEIYGYKSYLANNLDNIILSFFLEVRDEEGKLITSTLSNPHIDSSQADMIKRITLINTCYTGIYYVRMLFYKSADIQFNLKFNNEEETDNYIQLRIISAFPNQIVLSNKVRIKSGIISYDVAATNSNAEEICDERLNLYIEDSFSKSISTSLVNNNGKCSLKIKLYGEAIIKSNIDDFSTEINNDDNLLYSINPYFSSMNISPNTFSNADASLRITFEEKSPSLVPYIEDEIIGNKELYIYQYITPTKFKIIKSFSGLFSSSYAFTQKKFDFKKGNTYILIGTILDSSINPKFVHYQIEKPLTVSQISAVYFSEDKRIYSIPYFSNQLRESNGFELDLPFLLRIKFLDKNGNNVDIGKEDGSKLKSSIILTKGTSVEKEIELIIRHYNENYFFIRVSQKNLKLIKHLPNQFSDSNMKKYFLKITYSEEIIFYTLITFKNNNYQTPFLNKNYQFPSDNSIDEFEIASEDKSDIYIIKGIDNEQHICLYSSDEIVNQHLDLYKINIEAEGSDCFKIVNSYMGCFSFSSTCDSTRKIDFTYNKKGSSNNPFLTVAQYIDDFELSKNESDTKALENQQDPPKAFISTNSSLASNQFINVFINGKKISKKEISINKVNNENKIIIGISLKLITSIPQYKNITFTYYNGLGFRKIINKDLYNITLIQSTYDPSFPNKFKFKIQDPLNLKVGNRIAFYLLVKDLTGACFYGEFNTLSSVELVATIDSSKIISNITSSESLVGFSQCETLYFVDFGKSSTKSGYLEVIVNEEKFTLYISPEEIDPNKSKFIGDDDLLAGENGHLEFIGTDVNQNSINYFDLFDQFSIKLINSKGEEVAQNEQNYICKISPASDNSKLDIDIKINLFDEFEVKAVINGKEITLQSVFKIKVRYGDCSTNDADPQFLPIDHRTEFYSGETLIIQIYCKDTLGNNVTVEGKEIFLANIKKEGDDFTYDYTKTFKDGQHLITFTPPTIGKYIIHITLNGKKYGQLTTDIKSLNSSYYTCMDKRQVSNLIDCDSDGYKQLLKEIIGEEYVCSENGNVFNCTVGGKDKCVNDTNYCDCSNGANKTNGYCYPIENNPHEQINYNKRTCKTKLSILYPDKDIYFCPDGTCRFDKDECETKFECPIGFKSCGVRCILLSQNCEEEVKCGTNEVLCWDLTCSENYDLCPTRKTCPKGKILCPDRSCQETGHCLQPIKRQCENNQYQCPDFTCVTSRSDCIKNKVCPPGLSLCEDESCQQFCRNSTTPSTDSGKYRCSNGQLVDNSQLCPSNMYSPDSYINCPKGGVALSLELCDYVQGGISITCPSRKPILCPDFECVEKGSDCNKNIPSCPPQKPYQCWNNECRKSFDDCPTPIQCRPETPILCQSGLCVKSPEECKEKNQDKCTNYRCFDGACVTSMELCPTDTYCGESQIKCWNGACVNSINDCPSSILSDCPSDFNYRCPDGTCRKTQYDCSTKSVCPPHLPIKCYDSSCRASKEECPDFKDCPWDTISCPDGTCAQKYEECNTVVTCYPTTPFLCYDNSCKTQLNDCPEPPRCENNEFLCPDGSCMRFRENCEKSYTCSDALNPTRCEINTCTESYIDCDPKGRTRRCPIGYILCENGECKKNEYLCQNFECPKNMPYLCKEGFCVHDKEYCDLENGCPYNRPKRCKNGTCIMEKEECDDHNFNCTGGKEPCDDGSCVEDKNDCPLVNGCYKDRPFKCADGTCINPETAKCPKVLCPVNAPYKCPNGYCVSKSSDCVFDISTADSKDCEDGLIMCVDGRCVESSDYCRPSFECETGYKKCPDGTCRVSDQICPQNVTCPSSRPIRCASTQICVKTNEECTFGLICPLGLTKCQTNGYCREDNDICPTVSNKEENGCINGGVKCPNGRCRKSLSECSLISNACPDENKPYLCSDGNCEDDISKCVEPGDLQNGCMDGKIRCKTGRCVENTYESIISNCSNNIGCPLYMPFRCASGICAKSERNCEVTVSTSGNLACDVTKPYSCYDRSCVSDPSYCKSTINCNSCFNGFCLKDISLCYQYNGYCPTSSPIVCPSGACADDIRNCALSFIKPTCSDGQFYCAIFNECLTKKSECLSSFLNFGNTSKTRRLFENFVDPLSDQDFINIHKNPVKEIISFKEEEGDSSSNSTEPSNQNKIEGVFCYDGTIAPNYSECPIIPPCKIGQYRCENGACISEFSKCPTDENYKCDADQKKCPDGMCHKDCSEIFFQGCEVGKYQCSNGFCVDDKYDCIGHSMCPELDKPFRCINGECKSNPEDCEDIERLDSVKNITYSFNKMNKIEFSFAYNINGRPSGKIEIPSNAINILKDSNYSRLYIREVPSSILNHPNLYNNTPEFLFNISNNVSGSEGILTFENSVLSPIFKFYYDTSYGNELKFNKLKGKINIDHNEYEAEHLQYYDYCLAKLVGYDLDKDTLSYKQNDGWKCVERQSKSRQTEFQLKEFGVYAIILNPSREKINYFGDSEEKNFFLENVKIILIVLAVIIVIIALVFYIFFRVTRYRQKYHENRAKINLLKQQKQEYENMTTDIFGQTLGDNINGIVYKSNPAYTVTDEIKKSGTSLEEEIEKLQIECRNVTDQNERLQKDIENITEQYKTLSASIENMNK